MTRLQAERLSYRIGNRQVLNGISLTINPGDNIALLGANGAGKSTLLRILLGLLAPTAGQVSLQSQPMPTLNRRSIARHLAYVPQHHVPGFPFSVFHIVAQGRLPTTGLMHAPDRADEELIEQALHDLGIAHLAARIYTDLSGGERQLVLIARALVQRAQVLVLDEPITGLDYGHQLRLLALLEQLAEQGLSVVSSTHRPDQALASANRAWVLHEGRLIADGSPRDVIDSDLMQRLYQVKVRQIDADGHRFFIPC
ncbi:ABC transporter ATP-binding protein [Pseudomonas sp. LP_7_YM]|uniref:ABC transporter ATP-binding protein n=1 Tax=Pseudomonas sp. LP_7_YM TaxID=2485137 RepID=UPI0010EAC8E8|nr:ABC transporter ATP-binding protein [Pseudomonas sp. LP_7_YM]TDV71885.1 iron complex transport system ATP-binding protein [Pseudomonas sp. LP_7_YM]